MRYTIYFGAYFGIPLRIHFTFPLILVAFGTAAWINGGPGDAFRAVSLVVAVFVCVVLHEFGHSLQIRRYGIVVRDIVLLPIGGMARAESIPEKPRQEIIVAISGPLVNFALAAILFGIASFRGIPDDIENDFVANLLLINMGLGIFNLVPAFPMDGGRILRGMLATRMPYLKATRYAKNIGQIIAILFALIGFHDAQYLMLPLIGVFVYFGAMSEERMVRVRLALKDQWIRDFIPQGGPMLSIRSSVLDAAATVDREGPIALPVTDDDGFFAGAVEVADLAAAVADGRGGESLAGLVRAGFPLISGDTPAVQAYYLLRNNRTPFAGVIEQDRFLGLAFYADLAAQAARVS